MCFFAAPLAAGAAGAAAGGITAAGWTSMALGLASTFLGAYGQQQQQKAQSSAAQASANYNAQIAEQEAATQRQLAQNEIAKGEADRSRVIRAGLRQQGQMAGAMGAGGFDVNTGSNVSLLAEQAGESQYDAQLTMQNARMSAYGHEVAATQAGNDASSYRWQAKNAKPGRGSSLLNWGGALLSGLGTAYNQFNMYNRAG